MIPLQRGLQPCRLFHRPPSARPRLGRRRRDFDAAGAARDSHSAVTATHTPPPATLVRGLVDTSAGGVGVNVRVPTRANILVLISSSLQHTRLDQDTHGRTWVVGWRKRLGMSSVCVVAWRPPARHNPRSTISHIYVLQYYINVCMYIAVAFRPHDKSTPC